MSTTVVRVVAYQVLLDVPTSRQHRTHQDHFTLAWPAARFSGRDHRSVFPVVEPEPESSAYGGASSLSLGLLEVAQLSDGTAVMIRSDRGFSCSTTSGTPYSRSEVVDLVRGLVLETGLDEDDEGHSELYSADWLVPRLLRLYDIAIDPSSVDIALERPLGVEFSDRAAALVDQPR